MAASKADAGEHVGNRRERGEPQLAFNYIKALSDFITIFTFGKGVEFHSPEATQVIIPPLLKRVWEIDNVKEKVLWEMGQLGGVSGDVFVKVRSPAHGYVNNKEYEHQAFRQYPINGDPPAKDAQATTESLTRLPNTHKRHHRYVTPAP